MSQVANITPSPIAALRRALGMTLVQMGHACGISKSQMHEVERTGRASLPVALRLEQLSDGRIDAAALNDDVKAARHSQNIKSARALVHSVIHTVPEGNSSPGSGEAAAADRRVIICDVCERRVDGDIPNACTFVDCPHSQRAGIGQAA